MPAAGQWGDGKLTSNSQHPSPMGAIRIEGLLPTRKFRINKSKAMTHTRGRHDGWTVGRRRSGFAGIFIVANSPYDGQYLKESASLFLVAVVKVDINAVIDHHTNRPILGL